MMLYSDGVCAVCAGYVLHIAHAGTPTRRAGGMCYVQSLKRDMHIAHTSLPPTPALPSGWSGVPAGAHRTGIV